jgi:DNA-binding NarL/FixJ family response regulator
LRDVLVFLKNALSESGALEQEKIRVLIANPTRIWRDMLYDTIREEPDIEVVGDVSDEDAIVSVTERTNPDCLIVPLDEPGAIASYTAILEKRPHVRIVAIGEGADLVATYWKSEEGNVRCTYASASREAILRALHFATTS